MSFPQQLRKSLDLSGLTQAALSRRTGVSQASLSRYLAGRVAPAREVVAILDEALGNTGSVVAAWEGDKRGSTLPAWIRDVAAREEASTHVEWISPVLVSGILQSPLYAREVFREGQPLASPDDWDRLARMRSERFKQLPDLHVTAVFPVFGLTYFPDEIRREQAAHLLDLIDTGRVTVLLVPEGSLLVGITSPLLMFRLKDGTTVASSDHATGNVIHEPTEGFDRLAELVKRALTVALPAKQSRKILEECCE
jgi:transcriptional regulator with XRE-family HTH domain